MRGPLGMGPARLPMSLLARHRISLKPTPELDARGNATVLRGFKRRADPSQGADEGIRQEIE